MLKENTLFGVRDKVKVAIDRLQAFEPEEGYYLAFSGGKDSQCIYHLAKEADVKFDAHYNITGIDPPELVQFIKAYYPDVKRDMYKESMWQLIIKNGCPPTKLMRYCCAELKEKGGEDRICITGVRWEESTRRANERAAFEVLGKSKKKNMLFNDNTDDRMLFENCTLKSKRIINPIIDWNVEDVWEYLNTRNIPHCKLYDEGWTRLGCIGCPMASENGTEREFTRWPKFYEQYIRTFNRVVEKRKAEGKKCTWENGIELMEWRIHGTVKGKQIDGQMDMFEDGK